jgi:hypothetical protein
MIPTYSITLSEYTAVYYYIMYSTVSIQYENNKKFEFINKKYLIYYGCKQIKCEKNIYTSERYTAVHY